MCWCAVKKLLTHLLAPSLNASTRYRSVHWVQGKWTRQSNFANVVSTDQKTAATNQQCHSICCSNRRRDRFSVADVQTGRSHTHTMYGFGQRGRESVSFSVDRLVLRFTGWSYGCGELDVFRCATTSGDDDRRTVLFNSSRHTNSDRPRISTHTRRCALVMGRPVCSSTFWALSFAVNTRSGRHTSTQPRHLRVLATESDSELFLCQLRLWLSLWPS